MTYILRVRETRIGEITFLNREAAASWLESVEANKGANKGQPVVPFHVNRTHWQEQEITPIGWRTE